jgi:hypothetical protein
MMPTFFSLEGAGATCSYFIPTGGLIYLFIYWKQREGVENIQTNKRSIEGCKGKPNDRCNTSEFITEQRGTLWCAAGAC